jgi:hypothetical protein
LVSCFSTCSAYFISVILRFGVSLVASTTSCGLVAEYASDIRTYCMVSVEAPCLLLPPWLLLTNARATPLRSTPLWW